MARQRFGVHYVRCFAPMTGYEQHLAANQRAGRPGGSGISSSVLMPFEILHFPFMLLGRLASGKSSQVAPLSGPGILLAGEQPVFSGFQFANHALSQCTGNSVPGMAPLAPAGHRGPAAEMMARRAMEPKAVKTLQALLAPMGPEEAQARKRVQETAGL